MKNLRNFFAKEIKKYDTSWLWTPSVISIFALIFLISQEELKNQILYLVITIFTFFVLLPIVAFNFKRRALYDPKLNMIDIFTFEELNQSKYLNRMFTVTQDPTGHYYGMYLKYEASRPEDSIFLYFRPDEIDFFYWSKKIREILGDQPVAGVSFVKEREGNRIGIKFWMFFSSDEAKVIYPLRSQW